MPKAHLKLCSFMSALSHILQYKIVAILRGVAPGDVVPVAKALYAGGIRVLEVTLNSKAALSQIEELAAAAGPGMLIGAGTVLDVHGAREAMQAGATFLISPIVDAAVITFAKDQNLVSIPGAYTATEIVQAQRWGGDIIKVFPVTGPEYIKALSAPLPHIRLMPTGGVNLQNINEFSQAGAAAFGVGSALVKNADRVDETYLTGLTEKARRFVQAIENTQ
jgi:2-dehydro-3-deoxyphosphogluconate aldolase/(4S)-4-hydroxy-2-oxoglutarate aldolase